MIEWATESPWWAFLFFLLALTTVENIYKYTANRLWKVGKWEEAYREEISKTTKLEAELAIAKQEVERYKEMYLNEKFAGAGSTREREHKRRQQGEASRQARDRQSNYTSTGPKGVSFEDIMRAKEAIDKQAQTNFNQRPTQEETWQKIKAEYRKHMKANHPDKVRARGGSEAEIAEATKMTQKLNADYELAKRRFGK